MNDVPVVGQPLAYGVGFLVLLVVGFTGIWGRSLVTVAHEGGHMAMAVLTFRGFRGFQVEPNADGGTYGIDLRWGVGLVLTVFAGYATAPLLGLGGAAVLADGNPFGVLAATAALLVAAVLAAENGLAVVITLTALGGLVWIALAGGPRLQAGVAVGIVWLLLIGGLLDALRLSTAEGTDPDRLAGATLVPRFLWKAAWIAIAVVALYVGGSLLLSPAVVPAAAG